jgi:kinetochore protein Spc24, fungi type
MADQQVSLGKSINESQDLLRSKEKEIGRLKQEEKELLARDEVGDFDLNSVA